jgi:hypothetical protein
MAPLAVSAYEVHAFTRGAFELALSNSNCPPDVVKSRDSTTYLFEYLTAVETKAFVVENNYIDYDYTQDHATYYVKCFRDYNKRCKRLHFFDCSLPEEQFIKVVTGNATKQEEDDLKNSYCGFVVVRPLPEAIIGRTVLRTYPSDGGRRNYTCIRDYDANVFGLDFSIKSLPFQEQDTVLAACATVALWSCFHKTADLFGTPSPSPATITELSAKIVRQSRPIPSHGLIVEQICSAISTVGLDPEVVQINENVPLVSLLYGHLRMGLPVLLGAHVEDRGLHAIAVAGYSLTSKQVLSQEGYNKGACPPMIGLRIDEFYAHDDQIGPFSRLKVGPHAVLNNKKFPVTFTGSWFDKTRNQYLKFWPVVAIIPVYNKIRVTFLDIQVWVYRLNLLFNIVAPGSALEWDVRLTTVNDYKSSLRDSKPPNYIDRLLQSHPRFIWRADLSIGQSLTFGFLADATDMARSVPIFDVIWHSDPARLITKQHLENPSIQSLLDQLLGASLFEFLKSKSA